MVTMLLPITTLECPSLILHCAADVCSIHDTPLSLDHTSLKFPNTEKRPGGYMVHEVRMCVIKEKHQYLDIDREKERVQEERKRKREKNTEIFEEK